MRHKLILSGLLLIGCLEPGLPDTRSDLNSTPTEAVPVVSTASPNLVSTSGGELLTLKGDNFLKGLSVRIGAVMAKEVILRSSQEIAVRVPTQPGVRGPVDVVVTNPQGSAGVGPHMVTYYPGVVGFAPRPEQPAGVSPVGLALYDLRGKGVLDVIAVYAARGVMMTGASISVLQGDNGGGFGFSADYPVSAMGLSAMAIGDFSGDGKPDIATVNSAGDNVILAEGKPDGARGLRFADQQSLPVGTGPINLVMADATGDGKQEIMVANYNGGSISVLVPLGAGKFETKTIRLSTSPFALAVGDLNGDKKVDIVYTSVTRGEIGILIGDGKGGFTPSSDAYPTGRQPHSLAIGDLNGDGALDILAGNRGSNTLSVYINKGDGTFSSLGTPYIGAAPVALALADVNGDGRLDVVAPCYDSKSVAVLVGLGDGYFKPAPSVQVGGYASTVAVGRINDDDLADIVTDNGNSTISVLINQSQ